MNQFPGKARSSKTLSALILGLLPSRQSFQRSVLLEILATLVFAALHHSHLHLSCLWYAEPGQNYKGGLKKCQEKKICINVSLTLVLVLM